MRSVAVQHDIEQGGALLLLPGTLVEEEHHGVHQRLHQRDAARKGDVIDDSVDGLGICMQLPHP